MVEYHGRIIEAWVIGDHKVSITQFDAEVHLDDTNIRIELDQCMKCGKWASEDEEIYGDGYCADCSVMCDTCQQYKPIDEMMKFKTINCNQCVSCNQIHKFENFAAPTVEVGRSGDVKVVLEYIGEGSNGDFQNDGIDIPLMRMSVAKKERDGSEFSWVDVDNSSYCTQIHADMDEILMNDFCKIIVDRVYDDVKAGNSIKRMCEGFSWANEAWIEQKK